VRVDYRDFAGTGNRRDVKRTEIRGTVRGRISATVASGICDWGRVSGEALRQSAFRGGPDKQPHDDRNGDFPGSGGFSDVEIKDFLYYGAGSKRKYCRLKG
jgi:hypothetical protein